ncbi:MAG TPA: hypothetical protein VIP70_09360 [Nitrososphaeraceae archaeon]
MKCKIRGSDLEEDAYDEAAYDIALSHKQRNAGIVGTRTLILMNSTEKRQK